MGKFELHEANCIAEDVVLSVVMAFSLIT